MNAFGLAESKSENYDPVKPDGYTKDLCPTLDLTCCDPEGLKAQFETFNFAYLTLRDHMFYHRNITTFLREHKVKPVPVTFPSHPAKEDAEDSPDRKRDPIEDEDFHDANVLLSKYLFHFHKSLFDPDPLELLVLLSLLRLLVP